MKSFLSFGLVTALMGLASTSALACDATLKTFPRDCAIQDRYIALRNEFQANYNININDIAEYKVIRFIDRPSW